MVTGILVFLCSCALSALLAFVIGMFLLGLFRKIVARVHWRYGPPIVQPFFDLVKLFCQRGYSHGFVFDLGIILSLAGSVVLVLFIPFGGMCPLESSGGMLVILYIMLFVPLWSALSGGEGANPNISIGISRKFMLSLGYEAPLLLVILSVLGRYKTISIAEIVNMQADFHWALFSPLFFSGAAYLMIMPAMLGFRPFDITGAPQEISSGPKAEYGGKYLALLHIEHAFSLFITLALFVDLFLGGGENIFYFFLKMFFVFLAVVLVHSVFPRLRIDQAVKYLWRWPALLALAGLVLIQVLK